ncbi:MAG: hypothetical protein LBS15_03395 [Endomicrobium sp.]|nr:hypothetical protein [Endomicrobium sp.]
MTRVQISLGAFVEFWLGRVVEVNVGSSICIMSPSLIKLKLNAKIIKVLFFNFEEGNG